MRAAAAEVKSDSVTDTAVVFAEFQRRLRAFVSRRVRDTADVEDIVQETFLRIHRHLGEVRGRDRLAAWVFRVARSAVADHYRRRRPRGAASPDHEPESDPAVAGHAVSDGGPGEFADCLAPMIESLPVPDREAIELSEIQGLTQRKAAASVGVTLSGMKSRVQRARRKLKAMLLDCCRVELDRRGGIAGYEPRGGACEPCQPASPGRPSAQGTRCCPH